MLLGFFETNINGREVIAHLGDTGAFHTSLHLFLDENTGLYVSFNSGGEQGAVERRPDRAVRAVRRPLFPRPAGARSAGRSDGRRRAKHAQMMAGNWIASRRAETSFLSITQLLGQTSSRPVGEGELVTPPGSDADRPPGRMGRGRAVRLARPQQRPARSPPWSRMARSSGSACRSCRPSRCSSGRRSTRTRALLMPLLLTQPRDPAAHRPALAGPLAGPPLPQGDLRADRARPARLPAVACRGAGDPAGPGRLGDASSRLLFGDLTNLGGAFDPIIVAAAGPDLHRLLRRAGGVRLVSRGRSGAASGAGGPRSGASRSSSPATGRDLGRPRFPPAQLGTNY